MIRGVLLVKGGPAMTAALEDGPVCLRLSGTDLHLSFRPDSSSADSLSIGLLELAKGLYADSGAASRDSVAAERMTIRAPGAGSSVLVLVSRIDVLLEKGEFSLQRFEGDLVVRPPNRRKK
jgi:hypothetical protein